MFENAKIQAACGATAREAHIPNEFARLERSLDTLGSLIERVTEQMSPVVRDTGLATGSPCPPDEQLVPLAERLRSIRRRVESLADRMDSVSQRIEL